MTSTGSHDPVFSESLADYSSIMAVPHDAETLPITWVIFLKRDPNRFTTNELEEAILRVAIIGSLLETRALADELAHANEKIDRDMRQVGELQRALLPNPLPRISGIEIAASYRPSSRAGGDLYDFFLIDREDDNDTTERWCVLIADASGHGLAAAMVITMVQSILRAHPPSISGPADLLSHVNRHLCGKGITGFVTAFLGIYEPATRRFTYACAGHPAPLLKNSVSGIASQLNAVSGLPLGIETSATFAEALVYARSGDTVLLYTDGLRRPGTLSVKC